MPVTPTPHCSICGAPGARLTVVDDTGSAPLCVLHGIKLVSDVDYGDLQVTLVLGVPDRAVA